MGWLPAGRFADLHTMQIVRLYLLAILVFFSVTAYADYPARTTWGSSQVEDPALACTQMFQASYPHLQFVSFERLHATAGWCYTQMPPESQQYRVGLAGQLNCPYGGSLSGMTCVNPPPCPEGEIRQSDGSCSAPPPPDCEPGCNGACGSNKRFLNFRTRACIDQCIYKLHTGIGIQTTDGFWYYGHTVGDNTGVSCTPDMDNSLPDPQPCPECECIKKKQSYAVMQGVAVCLEPGTPGSEPVKKQDPPKVETHTPAPTPENPNPEPVVTETPSPVITITPAPAGSPAGTAPTITETTTNADGSSTATEQSQDSFCQANPTHKVCRQEDAKTDCDKYPDSLGCSVIGDVPEFEPLETKEIDMSSIVLRELPSDNSCPAPLYFTVGGKTIPISFEPICEYASAFRPLVIAAAWLSAAFIIVGARKDSI